MTQHPSEAQLRLDSTNDLVQLNTELSQRIHLDRAQTARRRALPGLSYNGASVGKSAHLPQQPLGGRIAHDRREQVLLAGPLRCCL